MNISAHPISTSPPHEPRSRGAEGASASSRINVPSRASMEEATEKIRIQDLSLFYGKSQALFDLSMSIPKNRVTAFIGPSGCGKSTLLRCINRMNDLIAGVRITGRLHVDDVDVLDPHLDVIALRKHVGMVFQKSNPFPKSIYENVAYGLRIAGVNDRKILDEVVERSLRRAALWDEVKDRLDAERARRSPAGSSSGSASPAPSPWTRRCILMDEPCSALDPIATAKIEELIARALAAPTPSSS